MNKTVFLKTKAFLRNVSVNKIIMKKFIIKNFKRAIKNNIDYIHIVNPIVEQDKYFRATGKTTSLIKLANKYNLPIIYRYSSGHIKIVCQELNLDVPKMYFFREAVAEAVLKGVRMVLVDESISINEIETIKKHNPMIKVVGFSRIKNNINN